MLFISLFDVCGTYIDNCDIFIELPEKIFFGDLKIARRGL